MHIDMMNILYFVAVIQQVYCGFLDITDDEDNLASIWQNNRNETNKIIGLLEGNYHQLKGPRPFILNWEAQHCQYLNEEGISGDGYQLKTTECKVETKSGTKYGECLPHARCILQGGSANGFCGFLSTCCIVENSCGKSTESKVSYFEATDLGNGQTTCNFNVKLRNPNICQLRLDFIKFNLAPAELTLPQYSKYKIYKCLADRLQITPNHYNIPDLCGNNDKQHVYVHINQTDGVTKGVQLEIDLADRNYNPQLFAPSWKIKITQLECPGEKKGIKFYNKDVEEDFMMLAPLGALQYFTDQAGYIKSFGFEGSNIKQSYTYDQKYAIAFKRDIHVCGIKFTPDYFYIPYENPVGVWRDSNCKHYMFVPDLYFDDQLSTANNLVSKVCLKENLAFRSYAPGPLYVYFNSMETDFNTEENVQQGFNIKYELLSKCT